MIKTLFGHSIIYGIASSLQNAVSFVLLPVYTAYLSMGELGLLEIFLVSINILFMICQLGIGSAIFKYYTYDTNDLDREVQNQVMISSAFFFLIGFSFLFLFLLFLFRNQFSRILFESSVNPKFINFILIAVFFQLFWVIPTTFLRIQNKSWQYSLLNGAQFLFQIGIIVYLVIALKMRMEGVLIGKALASFVFAIAFTFVIRKQLYLKFSLPVIKELLSYSIFLVPVSVGILVLTMSNRYFILFFRNPEELGIFTVANKISSIILLAVSSFQMAWPSIMFRIKEHANAKEYYSRIFSYFVITFFSLALILTFFSKELVLIFANKEYISGAHFIPILCLSYLLYGLFYVGTIGINIYKKTYFQTVAMALGAISNLFFNFILIDAYGILGASLSLCFSFAVTGISAFLFSQRIYYISIEWKRIGKFQLLILGGVLIYFSLLQGQGIVTIGIKLVALLLIFPLGLYYFGIVTKREKEYLWNSLSGIRQRLVR